MEMKIRNINEIRIITGREYKKGVISELIIV